MASVLIGSDGLEYEDLTAKLCGEPRKSTRNRSVEAYRSAGCTEEAVRAWYQAYDSWIGEEGCPHVEGVTIAPESYRLKNDAHAFANGAAYDAAKSHGGVWGPANALARGFLKPTLADELARLAKSAGSNLPIVRCADLASAAGPGRTGLAGAVQAPPDPLHPAPEPKV
jgi:hypothetical protein